VTPEEIRRRADEILARSEFDRPEPNVLERFATWVSDGIGNVFDAVASGPLGWLLAALVVAAAVVVVGRFLLGADWRRTFRRRTRPSGHVGPTRDEVRRRTPSAWRAEAAELEAQGSWKLALRCRYRALVGDLLDERLVDPAAGRTTGELRADVAANAPQRAEAFSAASDLFDLAWYADRPTGAAESARFQELAASVTGARR
jgi:hypothetical protein